MFYSQYSNINTMIILAQVFYSDQLPPLPPSSDQTQSLFYFVPQDHPIYPLMLLSLPFNVVSLAKTLLYNNFLCCDSI